ncbi:MAG TPA: M13 family metallopeptidase [Terriglobia bacterium]|nr:M13 family metallopeptidase [Terriglobia bacterium]
MRSQRFWFVSMLLAVILPAFMMVAGSSRRGLAQGENKFASAASGAPAGAPAPDVDPKAMDKTCKPCQDLFKYADGNWLKNNPIPPDYPTWGRFSELAERNRKHLREILEAAAKNTAAAPGSNEQKIGDFYSSCMDEQKVEAEGAKPLAPEFARIEKITTVPELEAEVARLHGYGVGALFNFGSTQDEKNSTEVIGGAGQGGLGLLDRDYYTKTDDKSKQIRGEYLAHVSKMFELLGDGDATAQAEAKTVMDIETKLAEASMTRVERRDPDKTYHKMDRAQLKTLTPNFSWGSYFRDIGYPEISTVDVGQPDFFKEVNGALTSVPLADWKTYLRWHLVHSAAPALSSKFVDENFNFYGKTLQGTKQNLPRWKRCVASTDRELGFALGQVYVQKYFPPQAKARAQQMVQNLIAALGDDIKTLPWMSEATRKQALAKLAAFTPKIGYPDKWRDYSAYRVTRGPYVENVLAGDLFEFHRDLNKIGKPVDRTEWGMTPPTVNAYYNPLKNEIVFPAGILQPPFFDAKADDAVNYGGMGAVIGHEMTHGFDDQGRKFDAHGNLKNWWTPEDLKNYTARAACVEKQFDGYEVQPGIHENGKLVLGESIADLGGLTIAYKAFEKSLAGKPRPPLIDSLTPEQRFFVSYAQIWAANDRPEFERLMVNLNPHPLDRFRAIAAPSNMPAFEKAFDCHAGDPMVRAENERCQIW